MKTKVMSVLLSVCLILSIVIVPAYASNSKTSLSTITDTTSFDQEQYLNPIELSSNNFLSAVSEDVKVQLTCESFLAMAKAYVRNPKKYDYTKRIHPNSLGKDTIKYRMSTFYYESEIKKALKEVISIDNLEFTDFKVTYNGDIATASIVESYTYYSNDGFDGKSFRRKKYTFELQKNNNQWEITDVKTNDPWELDPSFEYKPIDVETTISNIIVEKERLLANPVSIKETKAKSNTAQLTGFLYTWTYYPSIAVQYAVNHYQDTSNPVFGFYSSDCQNFASQCVWAGLKGTGTSRYARPAVSYHEGTVSQSAFNVWCSGENSTYYTYPNWNWAWTSTQGFLNLMYASSSGAEGPYGNSYYGSNSIATADVGAVLDIDWSGAPSSTTTDHAMFITQVTGTYGSRTVSDIKVAAHTDPTNSAYQRLDDYCKGYTSSYYARADIWSGHYAISQP